LNATRVWLLPGSDFAVFNAVLKVGEIPVFYIPFFFYPADEMIIHPVIGYRTRVGNYFQTTTYIFGRPKSDSSSQSSLTKILGSSNDMEKKREGLFLRSKEKKKTVSEDELSLKLLLDYYSNLGGYIGVDFVLPRRSILTDRFVLNLGIGLTRNLYYSGGSNTPYNNQGETEWNKSNLFSMKVPFRYRLKTSSAVGGKYGKFSWDVPFYSDPLVDSDFATRAEEMDWINMLQKGSALDPEKFTENLVSSYAWSFSGQITPTYPNLSPYINNISLNNITLGVSFRQVDTTPNSYEQLPARYFFAPESATLYSVSGAISGTPLSLGKGSTSSQTAVKKDATAPSDPLFNIGVPRSPFEDKEKEEARQKDQADKLVPPELSQRFDLPRVGNIRFSLDYRLSPSSSSTLRFDYQKWKSYEDVNWKDVGSILTNIVGDGSVTVNVSHSEGLFSNTFSYGGSGTWRQYSYLNEEATEYLTGGVTDQDKVNAAKLYEYGQSSFSTNFNLNTRLQPLFWNDIFKNSSLHCLNSNHVKYRNVTQGRGKDADSSSFNFYNRDGVCLLRGTDWVFIYNSTFCPHSVFMCFVWISDQTAIISLYNIN
jgi:lipopolysaccharide assembly outer membrane protein LptD (OstA)